MVVVLAALAALSPLGASAVETYQTVSSDDPQVRLARFLDDDKRHFSAIVELRQIAGMTDPLKMPAEYQWRLADNYLGFGMRDRAEANYRNLAATAPDAKRIGRSEERRVGKECVRKCRSRWSQYQSTKKKHKHIEVPEIKSTTT